MARAKEPEFYSIKGKGYLFLVVNSKCKGAPELRGYEKDEENLISTFTKLGFEIKNYRDLKAVELKNKLKDRMLCTDYSMYYETRSNIDINFC